MNIWQRPSFVELCMNAEIGAYQEETRDERESPPLASGAVEAATMTAAAGLRPESDSTDVA